MIISVHSVFTIELMEPAAFASQTIILLLEILISPSTKLTRYVNNYKWS